MDIDEIKSAIASLPTDQRRKVAMYILELEKKHLEETVGPQIKEDIQGVSKVLQEALEKLKRFAGKS
ncbi:MAG: hypothetical protein AB1428_06845 [Bacteroidota bacterium]